MNRRTSTAGGSSGGEGPSIEKAKRRQRHQKIKCDGRRACSECLRRNISCVYLTNPQESHSQATKRRLEELSLAGNELGALFSSLAGPDEVLAQAIFRQIRTGQAPRDILRDLQQASIRPAVRDYRVRRLRDTFIISLAQSTASLDGIINLAAPILDPRANINIPSPESLRALQDRVITLETLYILLAEANPTNASIQDLASGASTLLRPSADGSYSGPQHWVPAAPWVSLTSNDAAVSHLVSLFLTHLNPYRRFIEEDLFLKSMRAPEGSSRHCSRLLVHAILACASQYSEIEETFAAPDDLLTRGADFHNEAIRLWAVEDHRASTTNIQALLILAYESSTRGQDQLGWSFVQQAAALNRALLVPSPEAIIHLDPASADDARARVCAANSTVTANVSHALAWLARSDELAVNLQDAFPLDAILPDTIQWWYGYPLKHKPVAHRQNLLNRQRWILTSFASEVIHLVLSDTDHMPHQLLTEVNDLSRRLSLWYEDLPVELRYSAEMPPPLYEFHAQTLCVFMILYCQTYAALFGSEVPGTIFSPNPQQISAEARHELRRQRLECAFQAASLSRDFGRQYGWRITPPTIFQHATNGIFIFLQVLKERQEHPTRVADDEPSIYHIESAFNECFRCLLGCGVQQMLPRAIARMIYHTARRLQVRLPHILEQLLQLIAETAWQPADLRQLDSVFPNPTIARNRKVSEVEARMGRLLKEWEEEAE